MIESKFNSFEFARKLRKLHKIFVKIRANNYQEAIDYWEREIIPIFENHPLKFLRNKLILRFFLDERPQPKSREEAVAQSFYPPKEKEKIASILPNEKDEKEILMFNHWYYKQYVTRYASLENGKKLIDKIVQESPDSKSFLISEKLSLENELSSYDIEGGNLPKYSRHLRMENERIKNKEMRDLIIRGQTPNWNELNPNNINLYSDIKLKVELLVYVKQKLENVEEEEKTIHKEPDLKIEGIRNWNLRTRFFLAQKLGLLENEFFKGNSTGQGERHKLVANLLRSHPDNAKKVFNGKDKITEDEKREVELYLNSLR